MNPYNSRDHKREARMRAAYEKGATLQKIGDSHGISRERVRQILDRLGVNRRPSVAQRNQVGG